jgi:biopolymer transport protein ExbD
MAEIIQQEGKQKGGKKKAKKFSTRIDMTPMVDLMCLLITFFMLTTAFSKPKAMDITMPEKKDDPNVKAPEISADRTLNVLVSGNDQIYYYFGAADPNKPLPQLMKSNYSKDGIRKVLLLRNKIVFKAVTELRDKVIKGDLVMSDSTLTRKIKELKKSDKNAPIVLIKADEKAKYKNLVDIIDEMAITNIANYAIVDITPVELKMIDGLNNPNAAVK